MHKATTLSPSSIFRHALRRFTYPGGSVLPWRSCEWRRRAFSTDGLESQGPQSAAYAWERRASTGET